MTMRLISFCWRKSVLHAYLYVTKKWWMYYEVLHNWPCKRHRFNKIRFTSVRLMQNSAEGTNVWSSITYFIIGLASKTLAGVTQLRFRGVYLFLCLYMWPSTGKPGTTRHPSKKKFCLHLQSCRRPDIELSKFYHRSLSRSHYNRPNCSLPSAWNNTFLRNRSIFSRYLRTPRCAQFSCRRSHILWYMQPFFRPRH